MNDAPSKVESLVALITGAASGVGAACADRFVVAGYRVGLLDRDADGLHRVIERIDAAGARTAATVADVTDDRGVHDSVALVARRWGRIDVVVNAAGTPHSAMEFDQLSDLQWTASFEVNVRGIARVVAAALPMLEARGGSVVNVTSVAGVRARSGLAAYCASKAAAISLTQTLALELAPRGIRVNSVGPGALDTPMFGAFLRPGETVAEGAARYAEAIPLGRLGSAEEIAQAIEWAASEQASFMTGQTIVIDGGRAI